MTFEKDYQELLLFANNLINKRNIKIDAIGIVSDAYLQLIDNNYLYSISNAKKIIATDILNYSRINNPVGFEDIDSLNNNQDIFKYCKSCEESLPESAFHFLYNTRTKKMSTSTYCILCHRKKEKEYRIRIGKFKGVNDMTGKSKKEKNKARVDKYLKSNREKWNEYLRNRYKQKKASLVETKEG